MDVALNKYIGNIYENKNTAFFRFLRRGDHTSWSKSKDWLYFDHYSKPNELFLCVGYNTFTNLAVTPYIHNIDKNTSVTCLKCLLKNKILYVVYYEFECSLFYNNIISL